jgi:hypothetical protein
MKHLELCQGLIETTAGWPPPECHTELAGAGGGIGEGGAAGEVPKIEPPWETEPPPPTPPLPVGVVADAGGGAAPGFPPVPSC